MPKKIGGLFGRKAYGPLHELAIKVEECTGKLVPLYDAWAAGDYEGAGRVAKDIDRLEGEADTIKNEIRASLSTSIFSSVEGSRVREVVKSIDNAADLVREVARYVEIRNTPVPSEMSDGLKHLGRLAANTAKELAQVAGQVRKAFDRDNSEELNAALAKFDTMEATKQEAFQVENRLLAALFDREKDCDAVSVMFLMRVIELTKYVTKSTESAAEALERLATG